MVCFGVQEIGLDLETLQKESISRLNLAQDFSNGLALARIRETKQHRQKIRPDEKQKPEEELLAKGPEHALARYIPTVLTQPWGRTLNSRLAPDEIDVNSGNWKGDGDVVAINRTFA